MPMPDIDWPPTDEAPEPHGALQRRLYHGRRHQRRLFEQHRTAIALLGTALAALLVLLLIAVLPLPGRNTAVKIPSQAATGAPTNRPASPSPTGNGPSPTAVPSQPPLPTGGQQAPPQTPPTSKPPAVPPHNIAPLAIEAESAASTLFGLAHIRNVPQASGDQTIGFLGSSNGVSGALRMIGLNVPARGTYKLSVFYVSGDGKRTARIIVNGSVVATRTFASTGDRNTIGLLTVRVNLNRGGNSLAFDNPANPAPDIDRVILSN